MKSNELRNQDELYELLKAYRKEHGFNDDDFASPLRAFFSDNLDFTVEQYEMKCFQLIELLTDSEVSKKISYPNEHIRMIARLLDLVACIQKEPGRYFSYIDFADMDINILPEESLHKISQRWNNLYNRKS